MNARMDALGKSTNVEIKVVAPSTKPRIEALARSTDVRIDALRALAARMDARLERLENRRSRLMWRVLDLQPALVVALIAFLLSV